MNVQGHHLDIMADVQELNGGRVNLLGIGVRSMSSKNGDRAALHKARLIVSTAAFLGRRSSRDTKSQSAYSREHECSRS